MPVQHPEELRRLGRLDVPGVDAEDRSEPVTRSAGRHGDRPDHAQAVPPVPAADDRRLPARGPGTPHQRLEHEAGFVEEGDGRVQPPRLLLRRGQAFFRHRSTAFLSRSRARAWGFWALHPNVCRMRHTCRGSTRGRRSGRSGRPPAGTSTGRWGYPAARAPFWSRATSERFWALFNRGRGRRWRNSAARRRQHQGAHRVAAELVHPRGLRLADHPRQGGIDDRAEFGPDGGVRAHAACGTLHPARAQVGFCSDRSVESG